LSLINAQFSTKAFDSLCLYINSSSLLEEIDFSWNKEILPYNWYTFIHMLKQNRRTCNLKYINFSNNALFPDKLIEEENRLEPLIQKEFEPEIFKFSKSKNIWIKRP